MNQSFSCPKCGGSNRIGDASCRRCGMVFQYQCPQCRSPVKCNDINCTRCGNTLSWHSASGAAERGPKVADSKPAKGRSSWVGPLIGLIVIFIALAGLGYYALVYLPAHERPVANDNTTLIKKETPAVDQRAPNISDLQANILSSNSVEIRWVTDEPSTSQVIWNAQNSTTNTTPQKEALVTIHSVQLTGLNQKATYYYVVRSVDQSGNQSLSEQKSFDIGIPPGVTRVEVAMSSMSIEEKPPVPGVKTYVRGEIRNTGEVALYVKDISVTVNITVSGTAGSSGVAATLDPYPAQISPGETHKFYAVVPNNTNPDFTVTARVVTQ